MRIKKFQCFTESAAVNEAPREMLRECGTGRAGKQLEFAKSGPEPAD